MKIRLPFLYPFLWNSTKTTSSSSTAAAAAATEGLGVGSSHAQTVRPSQRPKRGLATTSEWWGGQEHTTHVPRPRRGVTTKRGLSTAPPFDNWIDVNLTVPPVAHLHSSASRHLQAQAPQHIHRLPRTSGSPAQTHPLASQRVPGERAGFRTSVKRRRPDAVPQRYGMANEPPPQFAGRRATLPPPKQNAQSSPKPALPAPEESTEPARSPLEAVIAPLDGQDQQLGRSTASATGIGGATPTPGTIHLAAPESKSTPTAQNQSALGLILGMEPAGQGLNEEKPPHLQPPPYVHHFDTYTLVRDLQKGGFEEAQAVTTMKALRSIIADNMDLARAGIMSKGDAEMTTYLFRAACHEVRTEIRSNRHSTSERMRSERTTVQHEVDILSQKITQEISTLRDNLKGMFDDRKMAVRIERRDVENTIQELNYLITSRLTSEMRSEVEVLRWVLVRRTAMALAALVVTALVALRTSTYREAQRKKEEKRLKEAGAGEGNDLSAAAAAGGIVRGMQVGDDVNPELVSLG